MTRSWIVAATCAAVAAGCIDASKASRSSSLAVASSLLLSRPYHVRGLVTEWGKCDDRERAEGRCVDETYQWMVTKGVSCLESEQQTPATVDIVKCTEYSGAATTQSSSNWVATLFGILLHDAIRAR